MRLVIIGAGGYGRTVADVANQMGCYEEILFLDDKSEDAVGKCEEFTLFADQKTVFYPAFGNNEFRLKWLDRLEKSGCAIANIISPSAYISPTVNLDHGVVVLPGAIVNTNTKVGRGCIINCGSIIDHDCILGEAVHVCLGAIIKAENKIPAFIKIEAGQIIHNRTYPL